MAKFFRSVAAVLLGVASVDAFGLATFNAKNDRQRKTVPSFMKANVKVLRNNDFIALQEITAGNVAKNQKRYLPGFGFGTARGKGIATLWNKAKWERLYPGAFKNYDIIAGDGRYPGCPSRKGDRNGTCISHAFQSKKDGKKALVVNCHVGHNRKTKSSWKKAYKQIEDKITKRAASTGFRFDSIVLLGDLNEVGKGLSKEHKQPYFSILGHKVVSHYHESSMKSGGHYDHICVWNTPTLTYKYDKDYGSDHKAVMAFTK